MRLYVYRAIARAGKGGGQGVFARVGTAGRRHDKWLDGMVRLDGAGLVGGG